jgi:hypothetical protein
VLSHWTVVDLISPTICSVVLKKMKGHFFWIPIPANPCTQVRLDGYQGIHTHHVRVQWL